MKKNKFNLIFATLAATALTTVSACAPATEPLTADNDIACRDREGKIVDDDLCEVDNDGSGANGAIMGAALMYMFMSSNQYHSKYGHYPKGYNPKAYTGKTTSSFAKAHGTSRGGFGSSGRSMSAGS
jgi:hypothetical protein